MVYDPIHTRHSAAKQFTIVEQKESITLSQGHNKAKLRKKKALLASATVYIQIYSICLCSSAELLSHINDVKVSENVT